MLGRLADGIGRRAIFQYSILWYAVFTALTAAAWEPWSVMALRFLAGIGLGGMLVVDPSMLAEYLPLQRRGRLLVFLDFWWPVGLLAAIGLSWVFIGHAIGGDESWRLLFLAASFPAFLAFVVRRALPESPYFLARTGRQREAAEVLERITSRAVDPAVLEAPEEPESSARELAGHELRRTTALMIGVWAALNISYYGFFLWLPFVLQAERNFTIDVYLLLIDRVPPVAGKPGRPRQRPSRISADRDYDYDKYRREVRRRGITAEIARRGSAHGSGLGRYRWVVERTFVWRHQFKRLLVRYDRRHDIHQAFLALGCCLVCFRRLKISS